MLKLVKSNILRNRFSLGDLAVFTKESRNHGIEVRISWFYPCGSVRVEVGKKVIRLNDGTYASSAVVQITDHHFLKKVTQKPKLALNPK